MSAYLKQIHPVLPVKNVTEAIQYYVEKLGFKLAFKDTGDHPSYAGVRKDGIEIHLQWHDEKDWENGMDSALLRIYVDEVDILFEVYKARSVFHNNTSLKDTPWGTREFGFYDMDNNGLVFYKDL
ncbi:VOC family protein [uncultured Psychroserpens sp.]|uniref:VOC family protein n=1 Tax=uncultured Psychroserpens sp. TaxID=255436 RepID=UPI00263450F8|nr:VOC family protein [uncultured Psychroserpens sp.]